MKILILINLVLASILVGLLSSCKVARKVELADGTKITDGGHLGGKDFYQYKRTAAGTITFTSRSDVNESYNNTLQSAALGVAGWQMGVTQQAKDAGDAAVAIGAQKAGTAEAGIAAGVAEAGIAAETTKVITIPK